MGFREVHRGSLSPHKAGGLCFIPVFHMCQLEASVVFPKSRMWPDSGVEIQTVLSNSKILHLTLWLHLPQHMDTGQHCRMRARVRFMGPFLGVWCQKEKGLLRRVGNPSLAVFHVQVLCWHYLRSTTALLCSCFYPFVPSQEALHRWWLRGTAHLLRQVRSTLSQNTRRLSPSST